MKLLTIETETGARAGALLSDGSILCLGAAAEAARGSMDSPPPMPDSVAAILAGGAIEEARRLVDGVEEASDAMREELRAAGALLDAKHARLHAPIPQPSLILSHGLAYGDHLEEMGVEPPDEPTAFLKAPSSVTGPGRPIVLPPEHPFMVDFEGEFSLIIGRPCHNVRPEEAMACVAGYTIANDVSARDWVARALDPDQTPMQAALSWTVNVQGKQFPTFTPMGPVLVTADEIDDPHDLRLTTTVNGEIMQDASTGDLIFPIERIVAHFSQWYSFMPGDVITTGSPSGVGYGRDPRVFLRPGDVVEISVTGIGTLSNPVVEGAAKSVS